MNSTLATINSLLVFAFLTLHGCVYVAPKTTVKVDHDCDTATAYQTVAIDDTPGEGLVVLNDRVGGNLPAAVGYCGGDECRNVLWAIGRQIAVETVASVAYAFSQNIASDIEKDAICKHKALQTQEAEQPAPEVQIEDLGNLL